MYNIISEYGHHLNQILVRERSMPRLKFTQMLKVGIYIFEFCPSAPGVREKIGVPKKKK